MARLPQLAVRDVYRRPPAAPVERCDADFSTPLLSWPSAILDLPRCGSFCTPDLGA